MALFNECRERHAHIALDTADIVRDGDFSTVSCSAKLSRRAGRLEYKLLPDSVLTLRLDLRVTPSLYQVSGGRLQVSAFLRIAEGHAPFV